MRHVKRLSILALGAALGCGGGGQPAAPPQASSPAPSEAATPAGPIGGSAVMQETLGAISMQQRLAESQPQAPPAGGSSIMLETVTAIGIQNTLAESQAQGDAAAQASGLVAKQKLREIGAARSDQMNAVLDSMDP